MFATTGVWREISSNRSNGKSIPNLPASAVRWMIALVDPPMAMSTRTAFSNASRVKIFAGVRSSFTISTMRSPLRWAISRRRESAAGMFAQPVRVMPRASAKLVIVEAVPMTMQCPADRDIAHSISHHSS